MATIREKPKAVNKLQVLSNGQFFIGIHFKKREALNLLYR